MTAPYLVGLLADLEKLAKPLPGFVGDGPGTRKLYDAEARRANAIKACATEWAKVMKLAPDRYWPEAMPQVLFDTFQSYDRATAIIAAEAFLEQFGWKVARPSPE